MLFACVLQSGNPSVHSSVTTCSGGFVFNKGSMAKSTRGLSSPEFVRRASYNLSKHTSACPGRVPLQREIVPPPKKKNGTRSLVSRANLYSPTTISIVFPNQKRCRQ